MRALGRPRGAPHPTRHALGRAAPAHPHCQSAVVRRLRHLNDTDAVRNRLPLSDQLAGRPALADDRPGSAPGAF